MTTLPKLTLYQLASAGPPIVEFEGLRYKTQPSSGFVKQSGGSQGRVVLKSNDEATVVAECVGSVLAELVHLPIPPWGITEVDGQPHAWFCSEMQQRTSAEDLLKREQVVNPEIVADTLVFDIWTANDDRNMGGFVSRLSNAAGRSEVELLTIDFESCQVCRGRSALEINGWPPSRLVPRTEVLKYVEKRGQPYKKMCMRIAGLSAEDIEGALDRLVMPQRGLLQPIPLPWRDGAVRALVQRAHKIGFLLTEVLDG